MTALWIIVLCGALAVAFAVWAIQSVMSADAGSARMQEISAAVREGAQAYLKRQYTTIGIVGVVIFLLVGYFLGWLVAVGFEVAFVAYGLSRFFAARYLGGTLFAIITLGTLVHPAVARAYAVAPLRALEEEPPGELGLVDAAGDAYGGQILD